MTDYLRISFTYILPSIIVAGLIICGLWIVPDGLFGMYGNVDGKWMSWNHRSILEWSTFLDFGPYSPFSGTGTLFLPNLPWLNPGALALAIPTEIEYKHLFSYLVYLAELSLSIYLLYRELEIDREYAFTAMLLYIAFFFIPFNSISGVQSWYSLAPFFAHTTAAANLATVALLRTGRSTFQLNLVWGLVFCVCLFIAFSSSPMWSLVYVPVYVLLCTAVAVSTSTERQALPFRIGLILSTLAAFSIVGIPGYISATAALSARDSGMPPFLHPGMALLTVDYWAGLIARFSTCSGPQSLVLICIPDSPVTWVQIAALLGGAVIVIYDKGRRRVLATIVVAMIFALHFYFLLALDTVLGSVHIVGHPYIYWTLFPLIFGVAVSAVETVVRFSTGNHASIGQWIPAVANSSIAMALVLLFVGVISIRQPPMTGDRVLGVPPIAHIHVRRGAIHQYLQDHIALSPGQEFKGYAGLYLGADDGFVRKSYPISAEANAHDVYVYARRILSQQFGNMFQLTDLWDSNIPTVEDYGHWLTKQMFMFNRDLLARPEDTVDPHGVTTHIYRFVPEILAMLGARYIISDGTLDGPWATEVMHETSAAETTLRLYEIRDANLGDWSPTKVVRADDYGDAVSRLRHLQGRDMVVVLGSAPRSTGVVPAREAHLTVVRGGYRINARSSGESLLVLPVQFSHCWRLEGPSQGRAAIFRANIVQTGLYFQGDVELDLQFGFGLSNLACRRRDADDMHKLASGRSPRT